MGAESFVFPFPRVTSEAGRTWSKERATSSHLGGRVDVPMITMAGFLKDDIFALQAGPQFRFGHQFDEKGSHYVGGGVMLRGALQGLSFEAGSALVVPVVNANAGVTSRGPYVGTGASMSFLVDGCAVAFGPSLNYTVDYSFKGESPNQSLSFGVQAGLLF
jgi:hypothetical protein